MALFQDFTVNADGPKVGDRVESCLSLPLTSLRLDPTLRLQNDIYINILVAKDYVRSYNFGHTGCKQ